MARMENAQIVWQGPSNYDGTEVTLLFTPASGNDKTADVAAYWVIPSVLLTARPSVPFPGRHYKTKPAGKASVTPAGELRMKNRAKPHVFAGYQTSKEHYCGESSAAMILRYLLLNGLDVATCGHCPHRSKASGGKGTCYTHALVLCNGLAGILRSLWASQERGESRTATVEECVQYMLQTGKRLRIMAYGDQGAIPPAVRESHITPVANAAKGILAYTHEETENPGRAMISSESLAQSIEAWGKGLRTFRIIPNVEAKHKNEVLCPASLEAGYRTDCASCGLCDQSRQAKSVAIVAHGNAKKRLVMELAIA